MAETNETPTVVTSVEQNEKSEVVNELESKLKVKEGNGHTEDKVKEDNGHTDVDNVKENNGHTEDKVEEDNGHTEDKVEENPLKRKEISDIKESPKKKKIDADEKQTEPIVGET